jgi:hypothetical protein
MPEFRPLSAQEVATLRARRRGSVDLSEYTDFIGSLEIGEGGEVTLSPSDQRRAVKRRLTRAARQIGKDIHYRRSEDNIVRFEVWSLPAA